MPAIRQVQQLIWNGIVIVLFLDLKDTYLHIPIKCQSNFLFCLAK